MTARPLLTDEAIEWSVEKLLDETRARAIEAYGDDSIYGIDDVPLTARVAFREWCETRQALREYRRTGAREDRAHAREEAAQAARAMLRLVELLGD